MAGLRQHLDEAYGECLKHVDGVGEEGMGKGENKKSESGNTVTKGKDGRGKSQNRKGGKEQEEEVVDDPVEAFLKMKRNEKYAHLMMLGSYY